MVEELLRIAVVHVHHETAVAFGRVRACALVQNRAHYAIQSPFLDLLEKLVLVEIVGELAIGQVLELVALPEIIHRNDVGYATIIERLHQIRADEACRSSYHVIHEPLRVPRDEG